MATTVEPRGGTQPYVDADEYIDFQLAKTQSQIKTTELLTSAGWLGLAVLGYVLTFVVLDQWVIPGGFGALARSIWLGILLVGGGTWLSWRILLPGFKTVHELYAAKMIESADPTLKSSLLNLIDLHQHGKKSQSALVMTSMEKRAAVELSKVNVDQAIDRQTLLRVAYGLLAMVVACCLYVMLSPKDAFSSVQRLLLPSTQLAVATRTLIANVTPEDTRVLAGEMLTIEADILGQTPEQVKVVYTTADREFVDQPVEMQRLEEGTSRYRGIISGEKGRGLMQALSYRLEAGDARTRDFNVQVLEPPTSKAEKVSYTFPTYMKLDPKIHPGGHIDAWEGTRVVVSATTNLPVKSALLVMTDTDNPLAKGEEVRMQITNGKQLTAEWTLGFRSDGTFARYYHIECTTPAGESDPQPTVYAIKIQPDQRPDVSLLHPTQDLERPANAVVPLSIRASDPDFQLRFVTLRVEKGGEEMLNAALLDHERATYEGTHDLHLDKLGATGLKPGDEILYWIEARDNKQPHGNRSVTSRLKIKITPPVKADEVAQQLEQDRQKQQEQLEQADAANNPNGEQQPPPAGTPDQPRQPPQPPKNGERRPQDQPPRDRKDNPNEPPADPETDAANPSEKEPQPGDKNAAGEPRPNQGQPDQNQPAKNQPGKDPSGRPKPGQQGQGQEPRGAQDQPGDSPNDDNPPGKPDQQGTGNGRDRPQPNSSRPNSPRNGQPSKSEPQQPRPADDPTALQKFIEKQQKEAESNPDAGDQQSGQEQDGAGQKSGAGDQPMSDSQDRPRQAQDNPKSDGDSSQPKPDSQNADPQNKADQSNPTGNQPGRRPNQRSQDQATEPGQQPNTGNGKNQKQADQPRPGMDQPKSDRQPDPSQTGAEQGRGQPGNDPQAKPRPGQDNKSGKQSDQKQSDQQSASQPNSGKTDPRKMTPGKTDSGQRPRDPMPKPDDADPQGKQSADGTSKKAGQEPAPGDPQKKPMGNDTGRGQNPKGENPKSQQPPMPEGTDADGQTAPGDEKSGGEKKNGPGGKQPTDDQAPAGDQPPESGPGNGQRPDSKKKTAGDKPPSAEGNPDEAPMAEETPAEDGPGATKKTATGKETGKATGQQKPEGQAPRAENNLERQPGSKTGAMRKSDSPDKTNAKPDGSNRPEESTPADGEKATQPAEKRPGSAPSQKDANPGPGRKNQKSQRPDSGEQGGGTPQDKGTPGSKQAGPGDPQSQPGNQTPDKNAAGGQPSDKTGSGSKSKPSPDGTSRQQPGGNQPSQDQPAGEPMPNSPDNPENDGQPSDKPGADGQPGQDQPAQEKSGSGKSGQEKSGQEKSGQDKSGSGQNNSSDKSGASGKSGGPSKSGGQPGRGGPAANPGNGGPNDGDPSDGDQPPAGQPGAGRGQPNAERPNLAPADQDEAAQEAAEKANEEFARKASNLVLKKLRKDLDRGEVDQAMLDELGWKKDDLERFVNRLERQLQDPGDDNSPESIANRRQFEETLKSLGLSTKTKKRKAAGGKPTRVNELSDRKSAPPPEFQELFEEYTKDLAKPAAKPR